MSQINLSKVKYIHSQKHRLSVGWVPDDYNRVVRYAFAFMNDEDQFEKKVARNIINARLISSRDHFFYPVVEYSNKSDALKVSSLIKELCSRTHVTPIVSKYNIPPRLNDFIEEMSDRYFERGLIERYNQRVCEMINELYGIRVKKKSEAIPHHLNYPYKLNGKKVFFIHNAELGVSLGYVGVDYGNETPAVRWAYAFTHPNDQFTKAGARDVLMRKLKNEDAIGDFYEDFSHADDPYSEEIIDYVSSDGFETSHLLNTRIDAFWNAYE